MQRSAEEPVNEKTDSCERGRALLRAAVYGNMKVMFPMVASAWSW